MGRYWNYENVKKFNLGLLGAFLFILIAGISVGENSSIYDTTITFGAIMMLIGFIAVPIWFIWFLTGYKSRRDQFFPTVHQGPFTMSPTRSPMDIVRERYAHGEITEIQYHELMQNLQRNPNYPQTNLPPPEYMPQSQAKQDAKLYCPTCGKDNSGDNKYCIQCGSTL